MTKAIIQATDERVYLSVVRKGHKQKFDFATDPGWLTSMDLASVLSACGVHVDYEEIECDCDDRSWYGEDHDSACPVTRARAQCR